MAYPSVTLFGNINASQGAQGGWLDQNFLALAEIAPMPCSVSGTNVLTLTPLLNPPGITAYNNYGVFSGIAAGTNTGTVTANVAALGALNVYKDTAAGPAVLAGVEIVTGNWFALVYDAALNSSAGGFHLVTSPALLGQAVQFASVQIGTGATVTNVLTSIVTVSVAALPAQSSHDYTVTMAGAAVNDAVVLGLPAAVSPGVLWQGFVSAAGSVVLRGANVSAASIAATAGLYRLTVLKTIP